MTYLSEQELRDLDAVLLIAERNSWREQNLDLLRRLSAEVHEHRTRCATKAKQ